MTPTARRFRALHDSGCFVMPNPWDAGSAIALERLGFSALATTSAGFAFTQGLPDAIGALPLDLVLAHLREVVAATSLPVNADFQDAFAREPEAVAASVARCLETGVAGLSVEDASGDREAPLHPTALAVERVRAARAAVDAAGTGAVLTARCEAYLVGHPDPFLTAHKRLVAYAEAGADCLFAPGVREREEVAALVAAVAPKPLNLLVSAPLPGLDLAAVAAIGVRRVSVGSALARVGWAAVLRAARGLMDGRFDGLGDATPFAELEALFGLQRG